MKQRLAANSLKPGVSLRHKLKSDCLELENKL